MSMIQFFQECTGCLQNSLLIPDGADPAYATMSQLRILARMRYFDPNFILINNLTTDITNALGNLSLEDRARIEHDISGFFRAYTRYLATLRFKYQRMGELVQQMPDLTGIEYANACSEITLIAKQIDRLHEYSMTTT